MFIDEKLEGRKQKNNNKTIKIVSSFTLLPADT